MSRIAARFLIATALLATVAFATFAGVAQSGDDPRNSSEDYYDAVDKALCMAHHAAEGMQPVTVGWNTQYSQLPVGEPVDLEVRLRNPWLHQVLDIQVIVNTSDIPNLEVITGERETNLENNGITPDSTPIGEGNAVEHAIDVGTNASKVMTWVSFSSKGTVSDTVGQPPEIHARLTGRTTEEKSSRGGDGLRFTWDKDRIQTEGAGIYKFEFWLDDDANTIPNDEFSLIYGVNVYYNATSQTEYVFALPGQALRSEESMTVPIPVVMTSADEGRIDVAAFVRTNFDHPAGTNAANNGHFYRFTTMNVRGGDQLQLTQSTSGPAIVGVTVDVLNLMTRLIGFMTMFLVPVSMVTGGMFGKKSRRWLNKTTGGAKKRVLWHSAMSWIILGVASIHFLLALLEEKNPWDVGFFWGGISWALLVSLGVTGYYQVRMIKRWNYKTWRYTHLLTAIGVFAFGFMHTFIDGGDLGMVRDAMPWLAKLVFP